jgi:hypothetical protein
MITLFGLIEVGKRRNGFLRKPKQMNSPGEFLVS